MEIKICSEIACNCEPGGRSINPLSIVKEAANKSDYNNAPDEHPQKRVGLLSRCREEARYDVRQWVTEKNTVDDQFQGPRFQQFCHRNNEGAGDGRSQIAAMGSRVGCEPSLHGNVGTPLCQELSKALADRGYGYEVWHHIIPNAQAPFQFPKPLSPGSSSRAPGRQFELLHFLTCGEVLHRQPAA